MTTDTEAFRAARDLLFDRRDDHAAACATFRWPALTTFNWAWDWFDDVAARRPGALALIALGDATRETVTFSRMAARSHRVAACLAARGVKKGDRVLLMMRNVPALWETMLACMRLGAVIVPGAVQLVAADVQDRVDRGGVRHAIVDVAEASRLGSVTGLATRVAVGQGPIAPGWEDFATITAGERPPVARPEDLVASDPLFLYFTSGTTAKPKLVLHTHASYPAGHLSTMYFAGLRPGDVHWNISSPGWAKHAWSNVFAPWNAEATVLVHDTPRFVARTALEVCVRERVTTLCAPPTVWRMLILEDLAAHPVQLREIVAAGEPLNPEIIERVRAAWGITMRDGYGQTETTAMIANTPGQPVVPGAMGRPLPGYTIDLLDADGRPSTEGEIAVRLGDARPLGLMRGYDDDDALTRAVMRDGHYRTGDVATRADDGTITYVGRVDDIFKASDYRISPFELESVLLEHPSVAEAAVVPSPDPIRLAVPKAFVTLVGDAPASAETARAIFAFVRARVAPFKRIRRIEFGELPKTISGKIRRVALRKRELEVAREDGRAAGEHWDTDGERTPEG